MSVGQIQATKPEFMLSAVKHQLNPVGFPPFHYGDTLTYFIYFAENLGFKPS